MHSLGLCYILVIGFCFTDQNSGRSVELNSTLGMCAATASSLDMKSVVEAHPFPAPVESGNANVYNKHGYVLSSDKRVIQL
jgi:hypothetical protein